MQYLGDYKEDEIVYFLWSTNDADGASVTRTADGTVSVYKDNGVTQSVVGVTDTEDFDGLTGIHACTIDTSADAFYAVGADYAVVLSAATIDGQTVNAVLAHFSIENRFQEVDVVKWLGTAAATPTVAGVPEVDITYIAGAAVALGSAQLGVNVVQISDDATAASDLELFIENAKGTDHKVLISTDAQDLNASLHVDAKAISASTGAADNVEANIGNLNATVSSRSSHAAADIWAVVARALTDKAGFSLAADQSGVTIGTVNTLTGHTAQTGDSYARIGVAGAGLSAVPWNSAWDTEVESECNDALVAQKLDHLVAVADGDDPVDNSIIAKLAAKGATADWSTFDNTTDSQEALADYITAISDLVYEPDASSTIATGTQIANTYAACAVDNGVYWQIADTGAGDGLDVICEFNLATTRRAVEVHINGYFNGSGGPVEIYVYNYVSGSWNKLSAGTPGTEMRSRANDRDYVFSLTVGNTDVVTSPGEAKIRFLTESSNAGDDLYLDYVAVIAASTGAVLPEAVANAVWQFDIRDIRHLVAGEYPAGHVIKRLVALATDVATANTAISFTLTDGITTNDAYYGMLLEVRDESSATRDVEIRRIVDWTSGKVVTVDRAYSFTPDVGDHVHITCGYLETMRGTDSAALATALVTHDTDIDTQLVAIQLDLNTPSQYKADVSNLDVAVSTRSSHAVADIWNELQSGHTTAGSFGKYLDTEVSGVVGGGTPATIADAVWDELKAGHATAGSFGALLALEATLTDIKGTGFDTTEDSLRIIRQYIDEIESGAKPPPRANFTV